MGLFVVSWGREICSLSMGALQNIIENQWLKTNAMLKLHLGLQLWCIPVVLLSDELLHLFIALFRSCLVL